MTRQAFTGAMVFDGLKMRSGCALLVEDGRVVEIGPWRADCKAAPTDIGGGIIAPGFIDLQVNGGGGVMLGEVSGPDGSIRTICEAHARLGTTGLLPTLITDTPEVTRAVVEAGIAAAEARVPGFLGLHLEGPHLDPRRNGAHDAGLIRPMTAKDVAFLRDAAKRLPRLVVTLAPEATSPGRIAELVAAGVVVSLGHSGTGLAGARAAFEAGARSVTHLFNAMSPLGHREPGLVGAALDAPEVFSGLIADGIHVAPEALRIALSAKRRPDRLFLVTDAMAVAGTDADGCTLRGRRILRRDGRLTLEDGTLAGADLDLPSALRLLRSPAVGLTAAEALRMVTSVPAACVGLTGRVGGLAPGMAADMVHLDEAGTVTAVWRAGRCIAAIT